MLAAALLAVGCASAERKAIGQMEELNQAALASLKKGRASEARKQLLEAVRVAKDAELDDVAEAAPVLARTQVALGAVYAGPLKDRKKAAAHMGRAVQADPQVRLTGPLATPAARRALAAAKADRKGQASKAGAEPVAAEKLPPARIEVAPEVAPAVVPQPPHIVREKPVPVERPVPAEKPVVRGAAGAGAEAARG